MDIHQLIDRVKGYNPDSDEALIRRAYDCADAAHEGQRRNSGEPYIIHPLHVAMILAELHMDDATICAGLLHDVLEDTEMSYDEMVEAFGEEITILVDGVTKLKQIQSKSKVENQVDNYRKMVMAMANDIRVIIIKLADRLHNLRTLDYKERAKQIAKATETIEIYVPIAHRLGISTIKQELEDRCLKYLDPDAYFHIAELLNKKLSERKEYIERIKSDLAQELDALQMHYEITGRPKTLYSIYKKMYQQNKTFDQIFDMTAIRVLVDTVKDCYSVLGVVHSMWKPIAKRFKDYIGMPKPNMYQSLHTTVIGPRGETFEVQIRTWEMHQTAEYGIAAHWRYKEGKQASSNFDDKLTWLRQIMEWQQTTTDSKEFLEIFKGDLFSDEVYVFSPKGDVIELPQGSTPIDFAYRIHSAIGNKCVGAKVDGRLVPLDHALQNGNIVEIITAKNSPGPSRDWLKIVKSNQARSKIRQFFKHVNREENIATGREMIERELKKDGYRLHEILRDEWILRFIERTNYATPQDLYAAVGYGTQSVSGVTMKLKEYYRKFKEEEARKETLENSDEPLLQPTTQAKKGDQSIRIKGEAKTTNLEIKFARCCSPVPGDPIVGFITKGRGISIHRKDCVNIQNTPTPERLIDVEWVHSDHSTFYATLQVLTMDRPGYLASLAESISKMGLNVVGLQGQSIQDQVSKIRVTVSIPDVKSIGTLMRKIRQIPGTLDVYRIKQ